MSKTKLKNIHPGEVLLEEFLIPMNISQNKLANDIDVPSRKVTKSFRYSNSEETLFLRSFFLRPYLVF